MSSKILIKRSTTTGAIPTTADLDTGEFAVNTVDKRLFTNNQGTIVEIGTTPSTQAVEGNATVGGTFAVTGATTLSTGSTTGDFSVAGTLQLDTEGTANNHVVTKAYVDTAINNLVDGAGSALDTLKELADAINNDANFATTITNSIATKLTKSGDTMTGNLNMGSNKVTTTANPTADDDLTRKGYVDTILGSATAAATSASEAATSASNAATSESNAAASATSASSSATSASSSASSASASATSASTSASSASTSATQASTSASNAATSATNAENAFDSFDDRYLGAKASDPTVDNDGDALIEGALYFNTTNDRMFVYTGSTWSAVSDVEALYNSGNLKLATTSTGVDVTGTISADGLTVEGTTEDAKVRIAYDSSRGYDVYRSSAGFGELVFYGQQASYNGYIFTGADGNRLKIANNGDVSFYEDTGTTAKMVWSSSAESLGIGTNASTIAGVNTRKDADSDVIGVYISNESTGANASSTYWNDAQGNNFYITTYGDGHTRSNETWLGSTAGSSEIVFAPNASERMRIDSSGNVGIGTSSPSLVGGDAGTVSHVSSSTRAGVRVTQTPSGGDTELRSFGGGGSQLINNANGHLSFGTNGSERARIDSSGNLLVGTTSGTNSKKLSVVGDSGTSIAYIEQTTGSSSNDSVPALTLNRQTRDGAILNFEKSGSTVGSIGVYDGRPYLASATVGIRVSNALFPSNTSGVITDGTMNIGGTAGRFKDLYLSGNVNLGGDVLPTTDAGFTGHSDLGDPSLRFEDAYVRDGVTTGSDGRDKQDIEELSDAEQRVAVTCKGLLRKWRWKDAVAEKGDDARIHFGIIAQDLKAAFEAEGLDAGRYAMFINSTWTDEETGEERSRMGVRYSELLAFIISAL